MGEIHINIRKIRQERGISQRVVAKNIGISASSMSKIETGKTDLNISRLFEIAKTLKVSLREIIYNVADNQQSNKYLEKMKSLQLKVSENKRDIEILQKKAIVLYEEIFLIMKNT